LTKIVHIITRLDMGGSAQNTMLTCRGLSDKYEIVLVHGLSLESNMIDAEKNMVQKGMAAARKSGVRIISLASLVRRISPFKDMRALLSLIWLLHKEKPYVVHTHSSKAGILGRLAAAVARVPIVIHTPHGHVFYGHFNRLSSKIFLWIEKCFAFFTDRIIALTHGEKEEYLKLSLGRPHKLLTVHSGVDIGRYMHHKIDVIEKKQALGLPSKGFIVGFVGWLLPIKGPMHLLKAMAQVWREHPRATLVFVGKGDLDVDLRAVALELEAEDRVKFLGWRDDIEEIMQIFDLLVLPSLNEGMGRVVVEAMAAGKPVVASSVGGIPDLVKHQQTGILVPPADEDALAGAIARLVENPDQAKKMGSMGRYHSYSFSLAAMIDKLDALYDDLICSPQKVLKLKSQTPGYGSARVFSKFSPFYQLPKSETGRPMLQKSAADKKNEVKPH
jgi:glycosyltransferase involved in cell wall biosynthesis